MLAQNLNLIPTEVVKETRLKSNQSKFISVSFLFLALCLIAFGISFYFVTTTKSRLSELKNANKQKLSELKSLESLEKNAQITQSRLSFISNILENKIYFSNILKELQDRSLSQIRLVSFTVSDSFNLSISGVADNTLSLQNYVNNLVKAPNNLFSNAKIMSLEISESLGNAKFTIQVDSDKKMLLKPNE